MAEINMAFTGKIHYMTSNNAMIQSSWVAMMDN
jgi:hypothetical protein